MVHSKDRKTRWISTKKKRKRLSKPTDAEKEDMLTRHKTAERRMMCLAAWIGVRRGKTGDLQVMT